MAYDEESPRTAFNRVGGEIEAKVRENPIIAWMRETNRRELLATFSSGSSLLEVGCGAGADAVFLAERGFRVAAIDVSDRMVELTRDRAREQNVSSAVRALRGRLSQLSGELSNLPWAPFDGAYANFSLAYEASLRDVAATVRRLTRAGANFVFTLPNRWCLSAVGVSLVRGHWGRAFDRFRAGRSISVRGVPLKVRDYTTPQVRRDLAGLFEVTAVRALPMFLPPSLLYHPAYDRLRGELERLDDRWDGSFPWRYLGDTTLFRTRRSDE